jgi:ATP-dependent DNA helicase RecG
MHLRRHVNIHGTVVKIADPHRTEASLALQAILSGSSVEDVESRTFDCKEDMSTRGPGGTRTAGDPHHGAAAKDLAEAAACFANSDGGALLVGVNDKETGEDALVGAALDAEWLRKRIWDLTDPHLTVDVQEIAEEANGKPVRLLLIVVQRSLDLHRANRKVKHRLNKDCVDMPPDDQRRALEDRRGFDWSAEPTSHTVDDVSPGAVERARTYLRESGEDSRIKLAREETPELLRKLGLADEKNRLNRAGVVMFVGPETKDEYALVYKRRKTPGANSTNRLDLPRPLIELYHEVKLAIDAANDLVHVSLPSGVRPQIRTIPDLAVREALVNALMHRDYRLTGPIDVEFVGSELIVDSPGGFVSGVDESNILSHPSAPRNATLARAFRALRLAEYEGVGVDRMFREMIRAGHAPPEIHDVGGRVRCVLLGGPPVEPIVELIAALPDTAQDDVDIALVVHELLDRPTLTVERLAPILQKGEGEALAALRRAEEAGVVTPTDRTAKSQSPTFVFPSKVRQSLKVRLPYLTTSTANATEYVVRHVMEQGRIGAPDIREQLGVGPVQASRILRALRVDQTIELGSDNETGPGVFYVKGPAFEKTARDCGIQIPK